AERHQGGDQRRAAGGDEGKRDADDREAPDHHADVHQGLGQDPGRDRRGGDRDEGVLVAATAPDYAHGEAAEEDEDEDSAEEAQLLADDREDEVVVRYRQVGPLLSRGTRADPPDTARTERPQSVHALEVQAGGVVPAVPEEAEHA